MKQSNKVLWLIALFKLVEATAILALAIGALKLLHHDVAKLAEEWIAALRIDPHNEHIDWLLSKLSGVNDHRLKQISAGSFVYAALRLVEGIGLLFRQRWAEHLIVIATALLIPLELHEIIRLTTKARVSMVAINVAVVVYLVANLRRSRK
jgi:uncharacterized membrane protein (DUF2068 family)